MRWRFSCGANVIAGPGKGPEDARADLLGRGIEGPDVVDAARERRLRRGGEPQQRLDGVGHRHERDARVGPHEAGVGLALRRRVQHLRRVVGGAARGHRDRRDQAREAHAAEVDLARRGSRPRAACSAASSSGRGARSRACCSRTSWWARSRRPRPPAPRAPSPRGRAGRRRRSSSGRGTRTGRPCDSPSFWANSSRCSVPSTLTWCAVVGVNSARVDRSAARWKTSSTSYSARIRSSRCSSRIEPANCCWTSAAEVGSSGFRSSVMIGRWPSCASRSIRPWPISPLAPVIRTTGLRSTAVLLAL